MAAWFKGFTTKGYTIIEILVAIIVVAIITAVTVPNLRQFARDQEISSLASDILSALKTAQSSAVSRIKCPNGETSTGWKIRFGSSNYSLIAQCITSGDVTIFTKNYTSPSNSSKSYTGTLDVCSGAVTDVIFYQSLNTYQCSGNTTIYTGVVHLTLSSPSENLTKIITISRGGVLLIQ